MDNLSNSQKWVLVAFVATGLTAGVTFFLEGDTQTFGYVIVGLLVAGFAVINSGEGKAKRGE